MTLSELRARLRSELGDEIAGSYLWSDALLDAFLGDAVQRLGEDVPLEREAELSPSADGSYALPADLVRLRAVESGGSALGAGEYAAWSGRLTLASPTSQPLAIRYLAARSRPPAMDDAGLRAGEDAPVVWLAASHALEWLSKQRQKVGAGSAPGAEMVAAAYARRYDRWLTARRRPMRRIHAGV